MEWESERVDVHQLRREGVVSERQRLQRAVDKSFKLRGARQKQHVAKVAGTLEPKRKKPVDYVTLARRKRMATGTEVHEKQERLYAQRFRSGPRLSVRPVMPWRRKVNRLGHARVPAAMLVLSEAQVRSAVARFKRTGDVPSWSLDQVSTIKLDNMGRDFIRFKRQLLVRAGVEENPGPCVAGVLAKFERSGRLGGRFTMYRCVVCHIEMKSPVVRGSSCWYPHPGPATSFVPRTMVISPSVANKGKRDFVVEPCVEEAPVVEEEPVVPAQSPVLVPSTSAVPVAAAPVQCWHPGAFDVPVDHPAAPRFVPPGPPVAPRRAAPPPLLPPVAPVPPPAVVKPRVVLEGHNLTEVERESVEHAMTKGLDDMFQFEYKKKVVPYESDRRLMSDRGIKEIEQDFECCEITASLLVLNWLYYLLFFVVLMCIFGIPYGISYWQPALKALLDILFFRREFLWAVGYCLLCYLVACLCGKKWAPILIIGGTVLLAGSIYATTYTFHHKFDEVHYDYSPKDVPSKGLYYATKKGTVKDACDMYVIIEAEPDMSFADLKTAYRTWLLKYHPDKNSATQRQWYYDVDTLWNHMLDTHNRLVYDSTYCKRVLNPQFHVITRVVDWYLPSEIFLVTWYVVVAVLICACCYRLFSVAEMAYYGIKLTYVPHLVSTLVAEYNLSTTGDLFEANAWARLRRLGAFPLHDRDALLALRGTVIVAKSVIKKHDFFGAGAPCMQGAVPF